MFVNKRQERVIQQIAVTLGDRLELGQQISEFLDMPLADVSQNTLSGRAVGPGGKSVAMGVVMMPRRRVAEPGEARNSLTLGEHVGRNPSLTGRESMSHEIAL